MTKKHFEAIANSFRYQLAGAPDDSAREAIARVAHDLCGTFWQINPRFDKGRFLTACGLA